MTYLQKENTMPLKSLLFFALISLLSTLFSTLSFAQQTAPKTAQKTFQIEHTLSSKQLNEQRPITIQLPPSYFSNTQQTYPVVYRLDGKSYLPLESATLNSLAEAGSAPEVIIVAIENTDRARDLAPTVNQDPRGPVGVGGGGDQFLNFIELELIPYVNKHYRTHDYKVLAGASIAGLLTLHAMQSRPTLFQAHIAYSPAVWWAKRSTAQNVKNFVKSNKEYDNYLYLNIGNEGGEMREVYEDFKTTLEGNQPNKFRLVTNTYTNVPHALTEEAGIFSAYHHLFLPMNIPATAYRGSTDSIVDYYNLVSKQHGKKITPPEPALRQLAYHFVSNNDINTATDIFKYNIHIHPKSADAYNGLAYGYETSGQFKSAYTQVNLALSLSQKGDPGYEVFLNRKKRLESKLKL